MRRRDERKGTEKKGDEKKGNEVLASVKSGCVHYGSPGSERERKETETLQTDLPYLWVTSQKGEWE